MPLKVINSDGAVKTLPVPTDKVYYYAKAAHAPVATPTTVLVIKASATKVVRLLALLINGAATAAASMNVTVTKRTTDGTVGSAALTALTPAISNTDDGAATASVSTVGTANYTTPGTAQGVLYAGRLSMTALATGLGNTPISVPLPAEISLKAGSTEQITVDLLGAALPSGGVLDYTAILEESDA